MENVKVYSPVEDKEISKNLNGSAIWKEAYHEEDLTEVFKSNRVVFQYSIKFNGLRPLQLTNVKRLVN